MARFDDRDYDDDDDRRDRRYASGRYSDAKARFSGSGAQASDDRHRQERWRHAGYGGDWQPGHDTDSDYSIDRPPPHGGDYYDPDHEYRSRRYQGSSREQPYSDRPYPGADGDRHRDRGTTRQQANEEQAWSRPSSWFGGEGRYRGVGPKGYTRSDDRIREYACDCLMDDPHLNAAGIEVTVKAGEVTLSGTVDDRFAKRLAEDLIEPVSGVKHVQNNLRIAGKEDSKGGRSASRSATH